MFKTSLIASGFVLLSFASAQAATPSPGSEDMLLKTPNSHLVQLADSDNDGGGSDDNGSDDNGSDDNDSDDGASDDSNDNGPAAGNDDGPNHDADDDDSVDSGAKKTAKVKKASQQKTQQKSKNKKVRVPGGRGCDSARDKAEHPECRV